MQYLWDQSAVELPPRGRGFHLITPAVIDAIPSMKEVHVGLLSLFLQHTSASLTINENADPDVTVDLETQTLVLVAALHVGCQRTQNLS